MATLFYRTRSYVSGQSIDLSHALNPTRLSSSAPKAPRPRRSLPPFRPGRPTVLTIKRCSTRVCRRGDYTPPLGWSGWRRVVPRTGEQGNTPQVSVSLQPSSPYRQATSSPCRQRTAARLQPAPGDPVRGSQVWALALLGRAPFPGKSSSVLDELFQLRLIELRIRHKSHE